MKQNKKYRPNSYSQQARKMSDMLYARYSDERISEYDESYVIEFLQRSYRDPMVVNRAAKRVGRMMRKGKVK